MMMSPKANISMKHRDACLASGIRRLVLRIWQCSVAVSCVFFTSPFICAAADTAKKKGALLKSYDFSAGKLGKEFMVKRGKWKVEGGALSAKEIKSQHHAASCHLIQKTTDAVVEFRFKITADGAKINLGFNPAKNALDKVGHLHAVTISSKVVMMIMAPGKKKPKENPGAKLGRAEVKLKTNTWYQFKLVNIGDECRLSIDGKQLIVGKHADIAVRKPIIIFRAFGEGIRIDDIKVWEIKK
jgi:hypothetical protein